jgi:flagellar protein FlbD
MIPLTRLAGTSFLLNADLIERVDSTPDTVVTLVDGTKYVVSEPLDVVLNEVLDYRARIVARATLFESAPPPNRFSVVSSMPPRPRKDEDR